VLERHESDSADDPIVEPDRQAKRGSRAERGRRPVRFERMPGEIVDDVELPGLGDRRRIRQRNRRALTVPPSERAKMLMVDRSSLKRRSSSRSCGRAFFAIADRRSNT
jgi:hypothetical protein